MEITSLRDILFSRKKFSQNSLKIMELFCEFRYLISEGKRKKIMILGGGKDKTNFLKNYLTAKKMINLLREE